MLASDIIINRQPQFNGKQGSAGREIQKQLSQVNKEVQTKKNIERGLAATRHLLAAPLYLAPPERTAGDIPICYMAWALSESWRHQHRYLRVVSGYPKLRPSCAGLIFRGLPYALPPILNEHLQHRFYISLPLSRFLGSGCLTLLFHTRRLRFLSTASEPIFPTLHRCPL